MTIFRAGYFDGQFRSLDQTGRSHGMPDIIDMWYVPDAPGGQPVLLESREFDTSTDPPQFQKLPNGCIAVQGSV